MVPNTHICNRRQYAKSPILAPGRLIKMRPPDTLQRNALKEPHFSRDSLGDKLPHLISKPINITSSTEICTISQVLSQMEHIPKNSEWTIQSFQLNRLFRVKIYSRWSFESFLFLYHLFSFFKTFDSQMGMNYDCLTDVVVLALAYPV